MNELTRQSKTHNAIVLSNGNYPPAYFTGVNSKQEMSRLKRFASFVSLYRNNDWHTIDLNGYADFLISGGLSSSSIRAHLSTLRTALGRVMRDRDYWYDQTPPEADILTKKAIVDEIVVRYSDALNPDSVKVDKRSIQDTPDSQFIRLSLQQQKTLLQTPDRIGKCHGRRPQTNHRRRNRRACTGWQGQ